MNAHLLSDAALSLLRNRFCISDVWVINEFSYKFYPADDMISVERTNKQ